MSCEHWRELILTDYLDGEISAADQEALSKHVAECHSCRELMSRASKDLIEPFRALKPVSPPPQVWQEVVNQLGLDSEAAKIEPLQPSNEMQSTSASNKTDGENVSEEKPKRLPFIYACSSFAVATITFAFACLAAFMAICSFLSWCPPCAPMVPSPMVSMPYSADQSVGTHTLSEAGKITAPSDNSANEKNSTDSKLFEAPPASK